MIPGIRNAMIRSAGLTQNFVFLTSGTSWTVDASFNSSNNTIECIGGGGGGTQSNDAGQGGGYSKIANLSLTPGAGVTYQIGAAGAGGVTGTAGGDTWFNGASLAASSVGAKGGGANASSVDNTTLGVGTTKYNGGYQVGQTRGGGAGGPHGAGAGGTASGNADAGFGGAGGSNGASPSAGGAGTEWDATHGSGGGGGYDNTGGGPTNGAAGGLYGGGGGSSVDGGNGGAGAQGLIVISWYT